MDGEVRAGTVTGANSPAEGAVIDRLAGQAALVLDSRQQWMSHLRAFGLAETRPASGGILGKALTAAALGRSAWPAQRGFDEVSRRGR